MFKQIQLKKTIIFLGLLIVLSSFVSATDIIAKFQWNATNGTDTMLRNGSGAATNYGTIDSSYVGSDAGGYYSRALIQFINTTKSIPAGSTINWVKLQVTINTAYGTSVCTIYPINKSWDEGTVTWNSIVGGCEATGCYNSTWVIGYDGAWTSGGLISKNITLNTSWYQRLLDDSTWSWNQGIIFIGTETSSDNEGAFYLSDNYLVDADTVPTLWVNYTIGAGDTTPPSFSNQVKNDSTIYVNENVRFNITITDSNADSYKFFWNASNSFSNDTSSTYTSGTPVSTTKTINSTLAHKNICWGYWANDTLGNSNSSSLDCFTVANTAPETPTVTYPVNSKNYSDIPYINYSSTDADGDALTYTLYINNTINVTGIPSNIMDWNASDGYYNLTVTAYDSTDYSANSSVIYFLLDSTPPTYTNFVNNATPNSVYGGAVIWNITITDMTGIYEVIFADNTTGTWSNWSFYFPASGTTYIDSWHPLSPSYFFQPRGSYICGQYWFNDTLGNFNQTPPSCFIVGNSIPTTPNVTSPLNNSNNSAIHIDFTSTDADSDTITYYGYINGTLNFTSISNITVWNASDGYYNLTVSAWDGYNSSANSSVIYFLLDSTAPSITNLINRTIDDGTSIFYTNDNIYCNATITDNLLPINTAIFSYNDSNNVWHNNTVTSLTSLYSFNITSTNLSTAGGKWLSWRYYANDTAGNMKNSSIVLFFVNALLPEVVGSTTSSGTSSLNCESYSDLYKKCYYKENNMCISGCVSGYACNSTYRCETTQKTLQEKVDVYISPRVRSDFSRFVSYANLAYLSPFVNEKLKGSWIVFFILLTISIWMVYTTVSYGYKKIKSRKRKNYVKNG